MKDIRVTATSNDIVLTWKPKEGCEAYTSYSIPINSKAMATLTTTIFKEAIIRPHLERLGFKEDAINLVSSLVLDQRLLRDLDLL